MNDADNAPAPPRPPKRSNGGGVFIALLTIAGAIIGGLMGQPSIGMLSGIALGVAIAVTLWLVERKRQM